MCELGVFPIFLENDLLKVDKIDLHKIASKSLSTWNAKGEVITKYRFIWGGSDGRCTISYKPFTYYNLGQNILGHLRKLGTKTHFAKLSHILPLKKAWGCCYKGLYLLSPSPPSSADCVNTAPGGRGEGRCLNLTSYCVSVPRVLTRVVVLIL